MLHRLCGPPSIPLSFILANLSFRLSVSVSAQQGAFAVGVLSDLYAFHRSTGNSLCPYHNACILCLTAAAGTELADAYSSDTVIASSPGKEVHDPWAFYLHAALLRQAFAHCGKFPTAASRRSLGRVSVPVWLIILSDQLLIIALPFPVVVPLPRAGSYALLTRPPLETPLPVRLACVRHAASVHPEPGSNSP
ncbi:putative cytochrome c biosynthesis protein [Cinnamomum micranthum f. kanehirae]|uniref:Putative cytochrome c biosynthesis protein n=1 Tax=Cinnamomum micranthum f. kanehirae TaxID=337451 RepID=A0A3S3N968_9MAGN|nr:putative cytochrome c biosynthesis protein [Cinnamomum micranthum f. kanehirae]